MLCFWVPYLWNSVTNKSGLWLLYHTSPWNSDKACLITNFACVDEVIYVRIPKQDLITLHHSEVAPVVGKTQTICCAAPWASLSLVPTQRASFTHYLLLPPRCLHRPPLINQSWTLTTPYLHHHWQHYLGQWSTFIPEPWLPALLPVNLQSTSQADLIICFWCCEIAQPVKTN